MKNFAFQKKQILKHLYEFESITDLRLYSIAQRIRKKTLKTIFSKPPVFSEVIKSNIKIFNKIMGTKIDNIIDFLNFNFSNYFSDSQIINHTLLSSANTNLTNIAKDILNLSNSNELNYFSLVIHGSQADGYITNYSDIDVTIFIKNKHISSLEKLNDLYLQIDSINKKIALHDPIGHHSAFLNLSSDLECYPQSFMPINVLDKGILTNNHKITFLKTREDLDLLIENFFNILEIIINLINKKTYVQPGGFKQLLSSYFMLIILEFEIIEDKYLDKKSIFQNELIKYAKSSDLETFNQASVLRKEWPDLSYNFIGISDDLTIRILEHVKNMCDNIQNPKIINKLKKFYLK